ncbi:ribbon-helix-helix protein, CopG family [Sphingomonas suaedae]|uniref:Ribbon-helix-helix protein, CopG family n=1 Tax=Sphingomonas suaedae TaxID=2599297 RepID=A0A518RJI3_9SPHN|nr:ribbon-helix-helix protein, CopG family [Sphingomonas suaedae]QDX27617.1 ribbon-helix-helix protein, CopG family [Sphingomonas suaedae]
MKTSVVTARLDPDTLAGLDKLAEYHERSRAWLVAKAVKQYVKNETEFFDFLQEGEDAIERGEYLTHEELMAEIKGMRQRDAA